MHKGSSFFTSSLIFVIKKKNYHFWDKERDNSVEAEAAMQAALLFKPRDQEDSTVLDKDIGQSLWQTLVTEC